MNTEVCLIGSDEVFRAGLESILRSEGFKIIGSFEDASQLKKRPLPSKCLAIVDLPDSDRQIEALTTLKSLYPLPTWVIFSNAFEMNSMIECFRLGAHGYIIKLLSSPALVASLRLVALGEKVMPSNVADELCRGSMSLPSVAETERAIETAGLSPREHDVLSCMMAGSPNKVIARQLGLCEATVKVHVKAILRKLRVHNRTQAAIWADSHGIHGTNELSPLP